MHDKELSIKSFATMASSRDNVFTEINQKYKGKKIVFVSGNFNVIHPGHLRLLRFAKECGDVLVVGVNENLSDGVVVDIKLRLESISAISYIDHSLALEGSLENFIKKLKPAVVVKGKEYEYQENVEFSAVQTYGGKLLFGSGDISFSSIDLLSKEFKKFDNKIIHKPKDFADRHNFSINSLKDIVKKFDNLRVCVIGDSILDEYISCDALGMSQEDPTIVVTPILKEMYIGGAAIVAGHARGLGAKVHFFSVVGKDQLANYLKEKLSNYGIDYNLYEDDTRPTTLKQRFRADRKTLLRVSHIRVHDISTDIVNRMKQDIYKIIDNIDLLIFSDFNYGCIPQELVDEVISHCNKKGVKVVADSQSSSQFGNVSRFTNTDYLTPTEKEARIAMSDFKSGLVILAERLRKAANAKHIFITLGSEGLLIHAEKSAKNSWITDQLKAFNATPKDTAGAGDSFLTVSSMAYSSGADIFQSAFLGSLAAACQVGRDGNIPLTKNELISELDE